MRFRLPVPPPSDLLDIEPRHIDVKAYASAHKITMTEAHRILRNEKLLAAVDRSFAEPQATLVREIIKRLP